jgi:hypothetical protein
MIKIVMTTFAPSYLVIEPNQIIKGDPDAVVLAINAIIPPVVGDFLLLETGDYMLLEDSGKIQLE